MQAVVLGAITGIGGGLLRDVPPREVPSVLRQDLHAIRALPGATVLVSGEALGSGSTAVPVAGASVCVVLRLLAVRHGLEVPIAPSRRRPPPA